MSRRAAIIIFVGALVLIDALARFLTGSTPSLTDDSTSFATPTPQGVVDERVRDEFTPLLARASENARALVALGDSKDRNILRIRSSQSAMEASLAEADAWLLANAPDASEGAVVVYRDGAAQIRNAMAEAQAGFLGLDFDRVARATEALRDGERLLHQAVDELATPSPRS